MLRKETAPDALHRVGRIDQHDLVIAKANEYTLVSCWFTVIGPYPAERRANNRYSVLAIRILDDRCLAREASGMVP